jgi:phage repressor protein C with HTH and peptisase S24 domain
MSEGEKISDRVREVMEKYDLNQTETAHQLGLTSGSYVSRILSGERKNLSRPLLERLETLEKRGPAQTMTQSQSVRDVRADAMTRSARSRLEHRRVEAGFSRQALAEAIGSTVGHIQALEEGSARISQRMAEAIVKAIPTLALEDLLDGSDHPPTIGGKVGGFGRKPDVATPPDVVARYVPLISWAQCGHLTDFEDIYDYEGYVAFNVRDSKAIAVTLKGDSMEPRFREGDVAILYPSRKPQTGNLVIAKIRDEGVVFKKFQILSRQPARFRFISENPKYEPIERAEEEIEWIYPVANVVNNTL